MTGGSLRRKGSAIGISKAGATAKKSASPAQLATGDVLEGAHTDLVEMFRVMERTDRLQVSEGAYRPTIEGPEALDHSDDEHVDGGDPWLDREASGSLWETPRTAHRIRAIPVLRIVIIKYDGVSEVRAVNLQHQSLAGAVAPAHAGWVRHGQRLSRNFVDSVGSALCSTFREFFLAETESDRMRAFCAISAEELVPDRGSPTSKLGRYALIETPWGEQMLLREFFDSTPQKFRLPIAPRAVAWIVREIVLMKRDLVRHASSGKLNFEQLAKDVVVSLKKWFPRFQANEIRAPRISRICERWGIR